MNHVLIFAIFRTEAWWAHVGRHLGVDRVTVLTDTRGRGDRSVTDDFYAAYRRFLKADVHESDLVARDEVRDAIARCRVLRWLPERQATAMVLGMAQAMDQALAALAPDSIVSLPIDSYVTDMLERRARARGIPYFELTAGTLPGLSMLLHRGALVTTEGAPDEEEVAARSAEISNPEFAPIYVQNARTFTRAKFHRVQAYFQLRAWAFNLLARAARDPLNLRALDSQTWLGHKARASDVRVLSMIDHDWQERLAAFPRERRVLFGLQMFPEASIDYWIDDLRLIRQEDMLLELARRLSDAGFQIVVKDHPLQFGFRQTALLEALQAIPNVVLVPYEVTGNAMLAQCGVSVTATGTLGLQAALLGNTSIAGQAYYVVEDDFVVLRTWEDLATVPDRLLNDAPMDSVEARRARIIRHVLKGSFDGPFMSLFGFKADAPNDEVTQMGRELGRRMRLVGPEGEDWHGKVGAARVGGHAGSPLGGPEGRL
ncbi:hypothetical protein [Brevundimonas sp.]|uniref:capsular polysaccharide export protein, LipB/KpsS family n=1 Tax=Brevundimonas sp. TaxID=1871086 RepID=UPI0025C13D80|nr:hypothetical protein [Brevundimonas sp.]